MTRTGYEERYCFRRSERVIPTADKGGGKVWPGVCATEAIGEAGSYTREARLNFSFGLGTSLQAGDAWRVPILKQHAFAS